MMKSTPKLSFGTLLQEGQRFKIQVNCKSYRIERMSVWMCGVSKHTFSWSANPSNLLLMWHSDLDIPLAVVGVSQFLFESYSILTYYTANPIIQLHLFRILARRMVCQGNSHPLPSPLADAADLDLLITTGRLRQRHWKPWNPDVWWGMFQSKMNSYKILHDLRTNSVSVSMTSHV